MIGLGGAVAHPPLAHLGAFSFGVALCYSRSARLALHPPFVSAMRNGVGGPTCGCPARCSGFDVPSLHRPVQGAASPSEFKAAAGSGIPLHRPVQWSASSVLCIVLYGALSLVSLSLSRVASRNARASHSRSRVALCRTSACGRSLCFARALAPCYCTVCYWRQFHLTLRTRVHCVPRASLAFFALSLLDVTTRCRYALSLRAFATRCRYALSLLASRYSLPLRASLLPLAPRPLRAPPCPLRAP